jgi:predicted NAD/FAD-binding protein
VVSSYLLDREHDVTLYEARDRLGGHSHTVDVTLGDTTEPVDTGFIVYNDRNYPYFQAFLDELDVSTTPTQMSFSFRDDSSGREYGGHGLRAFFAQKKNLLRKDHWAMLFDILRFNWAAPKHCSGGLEDVTLKEYLQSHEYSSSFVHDHLIPMVSAIWSVSLNTAMSFPFGYVVDFFENHGLLSLWDRPQWRTIVGGSREYLRSFRNSFSGTIRTADPVEAVRRDDTKIELCSERNEETYDAVVLATHSDQALDLLDRPSGDERSILGGIDYKENSVLLHTDQSVLPRNRSIWASWNYHRGRGSQSDPTVTYNMNILQGLDFDRPVCVSLNSGDSVASESVLDEFSYAHPVYTRDALKSQNRKGEICGRGGVYYAGAYWGNGFHEDGTESAVNVARKLGVEEPF